MRYEGRIYRPWIEADSQLIQVTTGCSNNNCTFCTMFKDKKFRKRKIDDIFTDIEMLRSFYPKVESIFLIDGNVMVLKTEFLLKVVNKIKATFPEIKNISLYSELNDLRRKSDEELKALKSAGINKVYAGLESGDPIVLEKIKKHMTPEQALEGMRKAKKADIDVLLSFIFGLGGRERSKEHIVETTKLLNLMKPEEIAPIALTVQPGSELEAEVQAGEFILPTPAQILDEEKYLLEHLGNFNTFYWGDHSNNIVPQKGWLKISRASFLSRVNSAIEYDPVVKQEELITFAW